MNLKKINEINEAKGPLFFLVISALCLGIQLGFLETNLKQFNDSIVLSKPALIPDNFFLAVSEICSWLFAIGIFISSFFQRSLLLMVSYFFVTVGFILDPPIINKLGYKVFYGVEILSLFLAVLLLAKYLCDKIDRYKSDNKAASPDAQKTASP